MIKDRNSAPEARSSDSSSALIRAAANSLSGLLQKPLPPGLYLVATPIGNLADITLRALAVLAGADIIYCEDTRHSAKLLQHFGLRAITRPFHEHNEDLERDSVLAGLASGKSIAVVSDAGTPLVSDPGFKLVRDAAAAGIPVVAIPGPSAALAALTASGLPPDAFFFAGFLPPKQAARRARLAELRDIPGSLIVFEAPQRLAASLADMSGVLGARPAAVARELTKLHEEFQRGTLASLAASFSDQDVKGEIVIVIGPPAAGEVSDDDITESLQTALESQRLKDAASAVGERLGVSKSRVYDIGLKLKEKLKNQP